MTTKASRIFTTPLGVFSYIHLPLPYYAFGIKQIKLADDQYAMMAAPEMALFDKIVTTSGLIRSRKQALAWLLEDMRINEDRLRECNLQNMAQWVQDASKTDSLSMIIKTIRALCLKNG